MKPLMPDVTVNGTIISAERIATEAQNHPAPRSKPGYAWKAAARALAVRELLLQEARARGICPAPCELRPGEWETEEEAQIRQLLEQAIRPAPATEAELRAAYTAAPERFRGPSLYEAAHILVSARPDDPAARAQARARAEAVLSQLRATPHRFADLAAEYSDCPSRSSGGILGQLSSGDTVPEFEIALDGLDEGAVSDLVETRYGVHLIRLDARARTGVLPFEAVADRLREAHAKAAWARASRAFVEALAARADVTGVALLAA